LCGSRRNGHRETSQQGRDIYHTAAEAWQQAWTACRPSRTRLESIEAGGKFAGRTLDLVRGHHQSRPVH
jgi:hypothetical protein